MPTTEECAASGVPGLDEILGGGFPAGRLYLINGESGTGKTTLGLQFLIEGARRGEKVLHIGTSETEEELGMIGASHGWPLDSITFHHHESPVIGGEQTVVHPAELELPRTMEALLGEVEKAGPLRVVIDSLSELRVLSREDFWYRRQLAQLKRFFSRRRCTVLLTEIPSGSSGGMLHSIAHGVINLAQAAAAYGPDRRLVRVAKVRGREFVSGYHDYRIRKGGLEVYPRLMAAAHRKKPAFEHCGIGSKELDAALNGGLMRGTSTLLLGPSGTGKSVMATQVVMAAAERGERSLFCAFDERRETLMERSEGIGLPLRKSVEDGTVELRQVDPAELTCGEFSHAVRKAVEDHGIQWLVIDSLNGYSYAMPEERVLSVHLHELSTYLGQQGVSSLYTMTQHGLLAGDAGRAVDVSYVADTVILFRPFEYGGEIRKAVSVYKSRSSPHETSIRELQIGPDGLQVGEPLRQFHGVLSGSPQFTGKELDDLPRHQ